MKSVLMWLSIGAIVAVLAVLVIVNVNWRAIPNYLTGINPFLLVAVMALAPLGGFSIAVVYLVAGARFGPLWGSVVVTGVTAGHLLLSHWIARNLLREKLEAFFKRRRYHLPAVPPGEEVGFSLLGALIPGLPYFARNYLIALSGLPLRIYFWICLPVYVVRSYLVIFLGDYSTDPDGTSKLVVMGAFYLLKLSICAFVIWRLRRRYQLSGRSAAKKSA